MLTCTCAKIEFAKVIDKVASFMAHVVAGEC